MMNVFKIFVMILILLILDGCQNISLLKNYNLPFFNSSSKNIPCWVKKEATCIKDKYLYSSIGSGATETGAINNALLKFAMQKNVEAHINNSRESIDKTINNKNTYQDIMKNSYRLYTHEKIKFWKLVDSYQDDKKYFVLISLDTDVMDNIIYLSNLKSIIKHIEEQINDINRVEDLNRLVKQSKSLFKKIDFKLLRYKNILKEGENKYTIEYKISDLETRIKKIDSYIKKVKMLSKNESNKLLQKILVRYRKSITNTCRYIENVYKIKIFHLNKCKIFLSDDNKNICTSFCGYNSYIALRENVSLDDLFKLSNIKKIKNKIKKVISIKQKLLILENLKNKNR